MTIKSECNSNCAEYAFLNITSSSFSFPTAGILFIKFLNLIIDRQSIDSPYMIYAADIKDASYICPEVDFLNLIEITPNAKFYVENTTFQNIKYNIRSIISAEDCRIELYNTNFININAFYCPDDFSVIMLSCNDSCISSSFVYERGNASLNNGYFSKFLSFGSSFISSKGFKNIKISDVEFENILVMWDWGLSYSHKESCGSLFCIYDCKKAEISNNKFSHIFSEYDLIAIRSDSAYVNWAATIKVDNNQFLGMWLGNALITARARSESTYILLTNLNISQSLFNSDIIETSGINNEAQAKIENIWICDSSFDIMIYSRKINLYISSIFTKNVQPQLGWFNYTKSIPHYDDIIQLRDIYDYTHQDQMTLISSNDGSISISNITIKRKFFSQSEFPWSFASIYNMKYVLFENIDIEYMYHNYEFISVWNSTQNSFRNIHLSKRNSLSREYTLSCGECFNITIFSSYFNSSSIEIISEYTNNTLLRVYDTAFEGSYCEFGALFKGNFKLINCSFYDSPYFDRSGALTAYLYGEDSWIITENCYFQFNEGWILYFNGCWNYQDYHSVFQQNNYLLHGYGVYDDDLGRMTSIFLFNGSEFYDNNFQSLTFKVEGILKFKDCTFLRNGGLEIGTSLFIENSTFISNSADNYSFISVSGIQSFIKNSYFRNNFGYSTIISSSSNFEIQNSVFLTENDWNWFSLIIIQGDGNLSISNTNFTDNSGKVIIYSKGDRIAKMQNSYFKIRQTLYAGSISFIGGSLYISRIIVNGWVDIGHLEYFENPAFIFVNNSDVLDIQDSNFEGSFHNAIHLNRTYSIRISRSSFKNGFQSRALEIGDHFECYLTDLQFINNTNDGIGGSILLTNKNSKSHTIIDNCDFYRNKADSFGGAILIDGCETTVKNSRFINNTSEFGGAIVSVCHEIYSTNYLLNNTFYHNNASAGGAIYWEMNYQNVSNNTFIDNYAKYGNITASHPIKLGIINDSYSAPDLSGSFKEDIVCSNNYNVSFKVALIDMDNQTVSYGYYYPLTLRCDTENVIMHGDTEWYSNEGIFKIAGLNFFCSNFRGILLYLSCLEKFYNNFNADLSYNIPGINIALWPERCQEGEIWNTDRCEYCEEGTFSLWMYDKCEDCPSNAYCYGGNQIAPNPGYWRGDTDSSRIYPCPNPSACKGGLSWEPKNVSLTGRCSEGYRGNLCQPCDFNYSSSGRNECEKCPSDQGRNAAKIIAILIVAGASLTFIVYFSLKTAYEPKSTISIYCRILINYLQMITFIARLKLNWPFYIGYWLINQGYPGEVPTHIVSIDCYLMDENDPDSYKSIYFKKLILMAILPAVLGVLAFLFWSFISIFQRNWKKMKNELIATLCILLFLILPSITDYLFSIYSCTYVYEDLFLTSNLDIICWEDDHLFYAWAVALPGIIVWSIGIPACVFLFLRKTKFKLHRLDTKLRFGFIYIGYRESTYYWEFILLIRKIMIICLTVFLTTEIIEIQTVSCASVFALFYYIQNKYYPYEYENLNKTELSSNFVVLITTWIGLFYTGSGLNWIGNAFFYLFLLLANAYFIFMWTRTMVNELKLLSVELFPFLKNYIDPNELKIKKSSEMKPIYSLVSQNEDKEIILQPKNRIKSSVDLSIFKIKENLKLIEQEKQQSEESSGELSVFGPFSVSEIEEGH